MQEIGKVRHILEGTVRLCLSALTNYDVRRELECASAKTQEALCQLGQLEGDV